MNNPINRVFSTKNKIKIMTHVIAGYPDLDTSEQLVHVMAKNGADLIEIQIPFSDPLADGPTIMTANQKALDNGITPEDCFRLVKKLNESVSVPLLFMTYINIPYQIGIEPFIQRSAESGISGLIIPDIPFDERNENYIQITRKYGLHPIQVVSPGVELERLKQITKIASGFIYTTLKVGITGARKQIEKNGLSFINTIKRVTHLPVAAGFGISTSQQVKQLQGIADVVVIGSHMINLFNNHGIKKVGEFLIECKEI